MWCKPAYCPALPRPSLIITVIGYNALTELICLYRLHKNSMARLSTVDSQPFIPADEGDFSAGYQFKLTKRIRFTEVRYD